MKISDIIQNSTKPFASFEIVPPLRGSDINKLYQAVEPMMEFNPPFINVTNHRNEVEFFAQEDGSYIKRTVTKRPGTVAIAAAIMKRFKVEVVPHIICGGISKYDIENILIDLNFLDIQNVIALRGDAMPGQKFFTPEADGHAHSDGLVEQIAAMNDGHYLDPSLKATATDFCIGVAGYPEKHNEAPNLGIDVANLKRKVDAGANYVVTQMFFDNSKFYDFTARCRAAGITVPIIPGLKPISTRTHIDMLPRSFSLDFPEVLMNEVQKCRNNADIYQVGVEWCTEQSRDLLAHGVPLIHYYTMGKAENIRQVMRNVF